MAGRTSESITIYCPYCGSRLVVPRPVWGQNKRSPLHVRCDEFSSQTHNHLGTLLKCGNVLEVWSDGDDFHIRVRNFFRKRAEEVSEAERRIEESKRWERD